MDHFSKYGLDSSDEEDEVDVVVDNAKKKMKTLQLEKRKPTTLDGQPTDNRRQEILGRSNSIYVGVYKRYHMYMFA